jgi:hypothetical protein
MISTGRSNYPEILKKIWLPIFELLSFFSSNFQNINTFRFLFQKLYEKIDASCQVWLHLAKQFQRRRCI